DPDQVFGIGRRLNPVRPFAFVGRMIGRHLPTRPADLRQLAAYLADRVMAQSLPEPLLVIGVAEMGTNLGQALFAALQARGVACLYLGTSRQTTGGALLARICESHSHAPDHWLHLPVANQARRLLSACRALLVVDDEATTAATAVQIAQAL